MKSPSTSSLISACRVCHRVLTDPVSINAGIGPVCSGRAHRSLPRASRQPAHYEIAYETADVVLIKDIGPWDLFMTITNAAEAVVAELADRLHGRRLEYLDSDGRRDQIVVVDGKFAGFKPVSRG